MNGNDWILLFVGGSGLSGLIGFYLTKKQNESKAKFDMIDRLTKEIERLDEIIDELRITVSNQEDELRDKDIELYTTKRTNAELQLLIERLENEKKTLKEEVNQLRGEI